MNRNFTYSAVALHTRVFGEQNREITFLTAEEGLIGATVFGGPKSRLRSHAAPYHQGKLWVYQDPAKDYRKVTDFDVQFWRLGIRELYERTMAAAAVADTILETHGGGGSWGAAFNLASASFNALENADTETCGRILIHFLWNWADILGQRHSLTHCESCACEVRANELLWYSRTGEMMFCSSCLPDPGRAAAENHQEFGLRDFLPLGPGARKWLGMTEDLDPRTLGRYTMDRGTGRETKAAVTAIIAGILGKRLDTWDLL